MPLIAGTSSSICYFHLNRPIDSRVHKCHARLKGPLPPGTRKKAFRYLENLEYLKRKGNNVENPIHIDLPANGASIFAFLRVLLPSLTTVTRSLQIHTAIISVFHLLPSNVSPYLVGDVCNL